MPLASRALRAPKWTDEAIGEVVFDVFKYYPDKWQIDIARSLYENLDVVAVAATGAGKTLTFWIPLLMMRKDGNLKAQIIVVAPLNVLGKQNEKLLGDAGIRCIALQQGTGTDRVYDVCSVYLAQSSSNNYEP
jgi:superfamily II DNA/RNA helicase